MIRLLIAISSCPRLPDRVRDNTMLAAAFLIYLTIDNLETP